MMAVSGNLDFNTVLTLTQVLHEIEDALQKKKPYSLARFGHGEIAELTWSTDLKLRANMEYYRAYAGATESSEYVCAALVEALLSSSTVGVLLMQDDPMQSRALAFKNFLEQNNIILRSVCSALITYEMHKSVPFWELLQKYRVVLVGRRAAEAVPIFRNRKVIITNAVELDNLSYVRVAQDILCKQRDWQIALVSAGIPATILAPRLAAATNRVVIDFGHALDMIIDGPNYDFEQLVGDWRHNNW